MSLSQEIEKLRRLHQDGALTDEEFVQAKAAVLDASTGGSVELDASAEHLRTIEMQNEVARLDREWAVEREQYMESNDGKLYVPSEGGSIVGAIVGILIGVGWMSFTSSMGAPSFFPLFGILFIVAGIANVLVSGPKASAYREAHERYQQRRSELLARQRRR